MGAKTLIYFFCVTTVAIVYGLVMGNLLKPGTGTNLSSLHAVAVSLPASTKQSGAGLILSIVPENIVEAMAKGNLLPVLFFAVMFGVGLSSLPRERKEPVLNVFRGISDAMFRVTSLVMAYSPIGVFGMISVTVANFGFSSLLPLAKLVIVAYFSMFLFGAVVLGSVAKCFGISMIALIRHIKDEIVLAFSTASSAAVMPQLMVKLETFGAPRELVSFVVPIGYSFNLDGAAIFLGIGTLFVAQLYGIELTLAQQAMLVVTMVLTSKGAAGVPGFMIIILSATLASAGLPLEGIAFIAGIYRIIDMATTTLNVLGNALAPLVIAKWQGDITPLPISETSFEESVHRAR